MTKKYPSLPSSELISSDIEHWLQLASREELVGKIREMVIASQVRGVIEALNDSEALNIWLAGLKHKSANTLKAYHLEAERFMIWLAWKKGPSSHLLPGVTREDCFGYFAFLDEPCSFPEDLLKLFDRTTQPFSGKPLSSQSKSRARTILSAMMDSMRELRGPNGPYVEYNPWRHIKKSKNTLNKTTRVERILSQEEWQLILETIESYPKSSKHEIATYHRRRWLMSLLYYSFLRRDEAARLSMSDFKPERKGWWIYVIGGKGNKDERIVATDRLIDELVAYRRSLGLPDYPSPTESLPAILPLSGIKTKRMRQLSGQSIYNECCKVFRDAAERVKETHPYIAENLLRSSTHWMRHTGITHALDAGIDIRYAQKQARHSDMATTGTYNHIDNDRWQDALKKL